MDDTHESEQAAVTAESTRARSLRLGGERAVERALERAAVREVRAVKRDEYAAQDAYERDLEKALRAERNAADDVRRAEAWQMAVDREMASAQRRVAWVDARERTAQARRAAKEAQRAERERVRPIERARMQELREEQIAFEDAQSAERLRIGADRAMKVAQANAAWTDAIQVVSDAKKEFRRSWREGKDARREARIQERAERDRERAERNAADDARADAIRAAQRASALATVELWEAQEQGDPARIARAEAQVQSLRAAERELRERSRAERNAQADAIARRAWQAGKERGIAEAAQRAELLEAKYQMAAARREAVAAERELYKAWRAEDSERDRLAREARNAHNEAREDEIARMNRSREFALSDLRQEWLEAKEEERVVWAAIKDDDKNARQADLVLEAEAAQRRRAQRNAEEDERRQRLWDVYKQREYDRSVDREEARATARSAYSSMYENASDRV